MRLVLPVKKSFCTLAAYKELRDDSLKSVDNLNSNMNVLSITAASSNPEKFHDESRSSLLLVD